MMYLWCGSLQRSLYFHEHLFLCVLLYLSELGF